ncbi:MAG: UDP-N-acetylmuramate dehydrogenase [Desulfomonile tiedjei]|nr:UDP-N-acetylmuramate dehydrogenase [Desulfomonile tiedjei]
MTLTKSHIKEIRDLLQGGALANFPLRWLTSFRIGGPADLVAVPANAEQLADLVNYLKHSKIPRFFLGAGTNVLFQDAGFRGVVVRMTGLRKWDFRTNGSGQGRITVAAGAALQKVIVKARKLGWTGMEALWGIPGSFGGAVATNAGAGGVCIGEILAGVDLLTQAGERISLEKEEIRHSYRTLDLPQGSVVLSGTLKLNGDDPASIEEKLAKAKTLRRTTQPRGLHSAGCVFKNPAPDNPAGAIIDRLGFKGTTIGDAQVSQRHANFIINRGQAKSIDVMALVEKIRERVWQEERIELEMEICVIGETADA